MHTNFVVVGKNSPVNVSQHSGLDLLKLGTRMQRSGLHLNYCFTAGLRCLHVDLKKSMSFISRSTVFKHPLDCAAFGLSLQTKWEVSKSFTMLSHKEEMLVFLLLLDHCLLSGSPLNWNERKWSDLFGVMDKDGRTEISV